MAETEIPAHDVHDGIEFVPFRIGRAEYEHTVQVWEIEKVITRHRDGTVTVWVRGIGRWRTGATVTLVNR